ncbi:hypothetical protein C4D60_Mb07t12370 [Musa balbisiana]|uniref:Uncharacterized protein n=1 Tax=Musa balbisiana TaxID=52838 RepID=A0A4S8JG01_MUSBA|nr:hypothetical protein C4D60_Mb07t12370 [Musa balbisiana]
MTWQVAMECSAEPHVGSNVGIRRLTLLLSEHEQLSSDAKPGDPTWHIPSSSSSSSSTTTGSPYKNYLHTLDATPPTSQPTTTPSFFHFLRHLFAPRTGKGVEEEEQVKQEYKKEKRMHSGRSMRAFLTGLACLLCLGLFISVSVVGRGANATPPPPIPVTAAVVASSRGSRPTGDSSFDPFHASKRRVPNGPDPIHNRICATFNHRLCVCGFQESREVRAAACASVAERASERDKREEGFSLGGGLFSACM